MDQDEVLEHDAHLDEGSTSDAGLAFWTENRLSVRGHGRYCPLLGL